MATELRAARTEESAAELRLVLAAADAARQAVEIRAVRAETAAAKAEERAAKAEERAIKAEERVANAELRAATAEDRADAARARADAVADKVYSRGRERLRKRVGEACGRDDGRSGGKGLAPMDGVKRKRGRVSLSYKSFLITKLLRDDENDDPSFFKLGTTRRRERRPVLF